MTDLDKMELTETLIKQATAIALECSITLDQVCQVCAIARPDLARSIADALGTVSQTLVTATMPDDWLRSVYALTAQMLDERRAKLCAGPSATM